MFAGDDFLTTAILDSLLHHIRVIQTSGRSDRLTERDDRLRLSAADERSGTRREKDAPPETSPRFATPGRARWMCPRSAQEWVSLDSRGSAARSLVPAVAWTSLQARETTYAVAAEAVLNRVAPTRYIRLP